MFLSSFAPDFHFRRLSNISYTIYSIGIVPPSFFILDLCNSISIAQILYHRLIPLLLNEKFKSMWNEVLVTRSKILFLQDPTVLRLRQ
jgi:hypothetical protein